MNHSFKSDHNSEISLNNNSAKNKRKDSIFSNLNGSKSIKKKKKKKSNEKNKFKNRIIKSNSLITNQKSKKKRIKSKIFKNKFRNSMVRKDFYRKSLAPRMSMKPNFKPNFQNSQENEYNSSKVNSKNNLLNLYYHHSIQGGSLKVSKSTLLELLSDKCLIEINLIQFVNPSVYCYDNFLNSLIFISKFYKSNVTRKSIKNSKVGLGRFWIYSLISLESQEEFLNINPDNKENKISSDKNMNISSSYVVNKNTRSVNDLESEMKWSLVSVKDIANGKSREFSSQKNELDSRGFLVESDEGSSQEYEELEKSNKFSNLVDYLEDKLNEALKKKKITLKKYSKLKTNSEIKFETSSESFREKQGGENNHISKKSINQTKDLSKMILE
jgi:hypothetical protein